MSSVYHGKYRLSRSCLSYGLAAPDALCKVSRTDVLLCHDHIQIDPYHRRLLYRVVQLILHRERLLKGAAHHTHDERRKEDYDGDEEHEDKAGDP